MSEAIEAVAGRPWAITEEGLRTVCAIATRANLTPEAVEAKLGRSLENTYDVTVRDGVAILPVTGPLFRYANLFTALSGATSYQLLARDFTAALEDPSISAILLNVDSPGGEVNGCAEFADMIFAGRGVKPIVAYVGGMGASGAYWIASAADEIVVAETAILGSIGVKTAVLDTRERDAKAGVRRLEIVSSLSPYKGADLDSEEGVARIKRTVDSLAEIFVATVARNRGVDREKVLADFGQGDVLVGEKAVEAGLADSLGSFEATLASLAERASQQSPGMAGGVFATGKGTSMSDTPTPPATAGQGSGAPAIAPVITAEHVAAHHPAIAEHFRAEGAANERNRILAIEALAEAGDEDLVAKAKNDSSMTAEKFAVAKVEKAKATREANLTALKGDEAAIDAPKPGASGDEGSAAATVASILEAANLK